MEELKTPGDSILYEANYKIALYVRKKETEGRGNAGPGFRGKGAGKSALPRK